MIRIGGSFTTAAVREIVAVYRDKKREREANKSKSGKGEVKAQDTVIIGKRDVVPVPKAYLITR